MPAVKKDEKTIGLHEALANAQGELKNPDKNKTAKIETRNGGSYEYQYADISDCLKSVLPVLSKHGISLVQPTRMRDQWLYIETILSKGDASIRSEYPVCAIGGDHKAMGSAMTYARRYALCSLIGIAAEDDTDGEGASAPAAAKKKKEPRPVQSVQSEAMDPQTRAEIASLTAQHFETWGHFTAFVSMSKKGKSFDDLAQDEALKLRALLQKDRSDWPQPAQDIRDEAGRAIEPEELAQALPE